MKEIIRSLTPSELFDLGCFFSNAVRSARAQSGLLEREFSRCLITYTGNKKIDKILVYVAGKIKLGENSPFVFAKTELYKLLGGDGLN